MLTRQLASSQAVAPINAVLEVLKDAGAETGYAVHMLRMLLATLIGTLLREVSAAPAFGSNDREGTLAASGLPALIEAAPHLARFDREAEFEYAVDLAITAVLHRIDLRRAR
ncbi:hypothetical protein C8D87_104606 [Lentzea atacamensis]|uniref:Tetracycline repressor TetR C-terminal domain-containing protein n=1 Tax=Lentzea atacamensis TaxID=531938 RepID=A0ABX9EC20_9PSEU|nr:hypothetical protein [Lentzea atacamensis]RAS66055.1 hypothetical protein C8D87_104606 [Lentzea atacamensis]